MAQAYRGCVSHQRPTQVQSITSAQASLNDDLGPRMRKYLISMSLRTLCFILAVVFSGPLRWVFAAGAILLPYVAVVVANAAPRRQDGPTGYVPDQPALDTKRRDRLGP